MTEFQAYFDAVELYFMTTGKDFDELSPTEQRKLMEDVLEREKQGNFSSNPRHLSGRGAFHCEDHT